MWFYPWLTYLSIVGILAVLVAMFFIDELRPLLIAEAVANAVRHGQAKRVRARLCYENDQMQVEIKDDGRGVDRDHEVRTRKGVGLTNIRARLEQLYAGEHRFKFENQAEGGVLVRISLPFRRFAP